MRREFWLEAKETRVGRAWKDELERDQKWHYPTCNIFFESSASAELGLSQSYFKKLLRTDATLSFVQQLGDGMIATVAGSLDAWRQQRRQRIQKQTPLYPFTGGFTLANSGAP